jgi:hypothetical protein
VPEDAPQRRTFTYTEAVSLVPSVRERTETAYQAVEHIQQEVDDGRLTPSDAQKRADEVVSAWARELMSEGLEIKGMWLVDFDNGSGYYCWQYPEPSLLYYHTYEAGFGGRVRIQ